MWMRGDDVYQAMLRSSRLDVILKPDRTYSPAGIHSNPALHILRSMQAVELQHKAAATIVPADGESPQVLEARRLTASHSQVVSGGFGSRYMLSPAA